MRRAFDDEAWPTLLAVDLDENVSVLEVGLRVKIADFIGETVPTHDGTRVAGGVTDEDRKLSLGADGR